MPVLSVFYPVLFHFHFCQMNNDSSDFLVAAKKNSISVAQFLFDLELIHV